MAKMKDSLFILPAIFHFFPLCFIRDLTKHRTENKFLFLLKFTKFSEICILLFALSRYFSSLFFILCKKLGD